MEIKKSTLLWVLIGVLFIVTLFLTFKTGSSGVGVATVKSASVATKTAASSGMVGGC